MSRPWISSSFMTFVVCNTGRISAECWDILSKVEVKVLKSWVTAQCFTAGWHLVIMNTSSCCYVRDYYVLNEASGFLLPSLSNVKVHAFIKKDELFRTYTGLMLEYYKILSQQVCDRCTVCLKKKIILMLTTRTMSWLQECENSKWKKQKQNTAQTWGPGFSTETVT